MTYSTPITTAQAARTLNRSLAGIALLRSRGCLHGIQLDNGAWIYDRREVELLAEKLNKPRASRREKREAASA